MYLFLNLIFADGELIAVTGDSRYELPIVAGSLVNAEFGAVSGPAAEVVHTAGGPAPSFVDAQPAGSAGAVTPSKFWTVPFGDPRTKLRFAAGCAPIELATTIETETVSPQAALPGMANG